MTGRAVRFVVALLLALASAVAGASSAQAYSVPWVPPSMTSGEDLGEVLAGGTYGDAGSWWWRAESTSWSSPVYPVCRYEVVDGQVRADGYWWLRVTLVDVGGAGCGGLTVKPLPASVLAQCSGGTQAVWTTTAWPRDAEWMRIGDTYNPCGTGKTVTGVKSVMNQGNLTDVCGAGCNRTVQWVPWSVGIGQQSTVEVTCTDGHSVQVVSKTGATGVQVTCPSGMVPIGATVTRGGQVVGSVALPSGVSLETRAACMRGECTPLVTMGGYSCDPTMAIGAFVPDWCRKVGRAGPIPTEADCVWQAPLALGSILLSKTDCASWIEGVAGPPVDDPEDPDLGIISEILQRIKSAIDAVRGAVDAAKEAVRAGAADIVDAVEGIDVGGEGPGQQEGMSVCGREPISNWLNPAEWAYDAIDCALVPGPGFMGEWVDGFGEGVSAGLGPWSPDNPSGPIYGMVQPVRSLGGNCSCAGFRVTILGEQYEILDTCRAGSIERMLRDTCHAFAGAAVVVAGVMTCGGLIARAFGVPWFRDASMQPGVTVQSVEEWRE